MRPQLQRELAGIGLVLVAVFVAGTYVFQPVPDDASCLATRGFFGPVGGCVKSGINALIGMAAAWLVPLAALVHGLRLLGRLESATDRSWLVFILGLAALLPVGISLAAGAEPASASVAGLWGSFVAYHVKWIFGSVGAWIVVALLLSILMAWTLRWNPVRAVVGPSALWKRTPSATLSQQLEPAPAGLPGVTADNGTAVGEAGDAATDVPVAAEPARSRSRKRPATVDGQSDATEPASDGPAHEPAEDELPPADLLTVAPRLPVDESRRELEEMGQKLMDALRTFRVDGRLVDRTTGPVVTQYEIEPAAGVKVRQFATLANDLALAMRAPSIRIVAPIPGRGAVGVEVPNPTAELVWFRKLIESPEFKLARASLPIALGEDLEGRPVVADLARMPHLLIAGATG
ncbi:MAG TPA: DNA translocase FtsK 4TM domain-containing protein, partial [Gemmatimonadaceae bacterium]